MPLVLAWAVVFLLGGLTGLGEVVSRYRDSPWRAASSWPGIIYVVLNALASIGALFLGQELKVIEPDQANEVSLSGVLATGFAAMAVLRLSVFNIRVGNQDLGVGPSAVLQVVLQAVDREVDRLRGAQRARAARRIMQGISFAKVDEALPTYCFNLMQNLSAEEQDKVAQEIAELARISDDEMDDATKAENLGVLLMNVVGEGVLQAAVENLRANLKASQPSQAAPTTPTSAPSPGGGGGP